MKELMLKVNELYDLLVQKNATADAREANLNAQKLAQDKIDEEQAVKKADLVAREAEVSKIESVVTLKKEAEQKMIELGEKQDKFVAEKTAHSAFVAKERQDIEEIKRDTESIREALKKETADLEKTITAKILKKLRG